MTQQFCLARFGIEMAWSSERWQTGERTWRRLTAMTRKYINLRYPCQDESAIVRAYKMSLREGRNRFSSTTKRGIEILASVPIVTVYVQLHAFFKFVTLSPYYDWEITPCRKKRHL
jgi:hypothetical protein